jgi:hypothetical protein
VRKYLLGLNAITDEDELAKLQSNVDQVVVQTDRMDPNTAVGLAPNPDLGAQHFEMLQVSKDDFNVVSATSSEQRGQADRQTATQSKIIDARSQIRESRDKLIVAKFLVEIGKELLTLAVENLTLPFYVQLQDAEPNFTDVQNQEQFRIVDPVEDLDDNIDFSVTVNISSLSPIDSENEKRAFIEFLSILTQFPQISFSPTLVRETAARVGYRNERTIRELQQIGQLAFLGTLQQAENNLKMLQVQGNQLAQATVAQNSPNTTEQIRNQLANQGTQIQ